MANLKPRLLAYLLKAAVVILFAGQFFFKCGFLQPFILWPPIITEGKYGFSGYTHDGPRPLTGIAYFPLSFKDEYPFQKGRLLPVFHDIPGSDRIYWAQDYLSVGISFLNLSFKAKKEIADPAGIAFYPEAWVKQSFLMPDGSRAVCIYAYCFSGESRQAHLAYIEKTRRLLSAAISIPAIPSSSPQDEKRKIPVCDFWLFKYNMHW